MKKKEVEKVIDLMAIAGELSSQLMEYHHNHLQDLETRLKALENK